MRARFRITSIKHVEFFYTFLRYVDDIALAAPRDKVHDIVNLFNSFHKRLKVTHKVQENNHFSFLDVSIILNNNVIVCEWYHKLMFSKRYLNYLLQNPLCHKIGTIYTLVDRAGLLSDSSFHQKHLIFCIYRLLLITITLYT